MDDFAIATMYCPDNSNKQINNDPSGDHDAIAPLTHVTPGDYYRLVNVLVGAKCKLAYSQLGQHTCRTARDSKITLRDALKMLIHAEYHSTLEDYD